MLRAKTLTVVGLYVAMTLCAGCALDRMVKPAQKNPPGPMADLVYPRDIKGGPGAPVADHEEANTVEPLLQHRTMYARYLTALCEYYKERGFLTKFRWALSELEDLRMVPTYTYGADIGQLKLNDIQIANRQEVDLVEELVAHRKLYTRLLNVVCRYYAGKQNYEKLAWAERERNEATYVKPYQYLMDATIPINTLQPTESIAEADALYTEGLNYMRKGGYGRPAFYYSRTMKQAINKLHTLLMEYPNSDKIAETAYWLGYIHKEYFYDVAQQVDDNEIAVQYFHRAYTWKPSIQLKARFEAAVVYDFRLHDRERALALYQDVIDKENFIKSNVEFSHKRIRALTNTQHQDTAGEPERVVKSPAAPTEVKQASPAAPAQPAEPAPEPASEPTETPKAERPIAP